MKSYHETFNKRSRLVQAPQTLGAAANALAAIDPRQLKFRVAAALRVQNDYFPCFDWSFPPPITRKQRGPWDAATLFQHDSVIPRRYSLYLHVPYCATLCKFCYYPVIPGRSESEMADYVDHLIREMALYAPVFTGQRCESVYIGGGTPTYLGNELLARLFDGLRRHFDFTDDAEISIESAPGTLPADRVALLRLLGVTRLSYGIQTLDAALLAGLNRGYSVPAAVAELRHALEVIGNVNVDTMYGFDQESEHALLETLMSFTALGVPGVSIYALDSQRCNSDRIKTEPAADRRFQTKLDVFKRAREFLGEQGFEPVLQNIFVRPQQGSYRHQLRRWQNLPLAALGVGAMGYAPRRLYQNHVGIKNYYAELDAGRLPVLESEMLSAELEFARELVSLLRFTRVDLKALHEKYGVDAGAVYADLIAALVELGYVEQQGDTLNLTDKAMPYNNIVPMLFAPDSFKALLYDLPEDYRQNFPLPAVLTEVGATQSAAIGL